jgi:tetratricopeptide (TPR) repeat protein
MNLKYLLSVVSLSLLFAGCKKDWLEARPSTDLVVPQSIEDYQALLDNTEIFNINEPVIGFMAGEQFHLSGSDWQNIPVQTFKNAYIWAEDIYQGEEGVSGWWESYKKVLYTNVVLEGIVKVTPKAINQIAWNNVKGSALFLRALEFYNLSQLFCKAYNTATANTDLGIPLRTSSDINAPSVRATLQQTYDQIINDLKESRDLLPNIPTVKSRPSKGAADALLARIYLSMEEYVKAGDAANKALQSSNELIDYNTLNPVSPSPFPSLLNGNKEVIFYVQIQGVAALNPPTMLIDSALYNLYDSNDLRKSIFFTNSTSGQTFKGFYTGTSFYHFAGLATDELYLIRAETYARANNVSAALQALNALLQKRYQGTFVPVTATNANDALIKILLERKKELLYRGIRWPDLRRLNKDNQFKETLVRNTGTQTYSLTPGDPKYVFLIPPEIIRISGIQQNIR